MSDPVKYAQIIRVRGLFSLSPMLLTIKRFQTRGKGPVESRTRRSDWKHEETVDSRGRFRAEIEKLSVEWKRDRAEKEEAKRREVAEGGPSIQVPESSDDEIDIVETTPAPVSSKGKKRGKRKLSKKNSDVMRLR